MATMQGQDTLFTFIKLQSARDKCSEVVHWDDPEGWGGEGGGRGFSMGNICKPMADSCQRMAKTTTVL